MPIGPVQLLVVSFDKPDFSGEILAELNRLRQSQLIRLIDVLVVTKDLDGTIAAAQMSDLSIEEAEDLGATVGALIGLGLDGEAGAEAGALAGAEAGADGHLIDESETYDVAASIAPGSAAAIALIEHVWAGPLRDAIAKAGGVAGQRFLGPPARPGRGRSARRSRPRDPGLTRPMVAERFGTDLATSVFEAGPAYGPARWPLWWLRILLLLQDVHRPGDHQHADDE